VLILLPTTWTDIPANTTDKLLFEDAEVRVDLPNPLYGNTPFTSQPGGCGQQGEYIQVTEKFLTEINTTSSDIFGPPGNVFVHEWSKYRYGVFEEYGYPGDPLYPMFYYKTTWTANGQENVLKPNFCTDREITGSMQAVSGGQCTLENGVPDSDCIFVGDKGQHVSSSVLAVPYITSDDQFCDDTEEHVHHPDLPNKHNALCEKRSVWDVVKSHEDFTNFDTEPSPNITSTVPSFTILRPSEASFVFVLDVSGSMKDFERIIRLRQAVKRWLKYDVQDGVLVGIVTFADQSKINVVKELTAIDEASRADMIEKVSKLNAKGGTCLDLGLMKGREVLQTGGIEFDGVLIFLTDGMQLWCDGSHESPGWGPEGGIPGVIDTIADSGIRVITIAFGPNAQDDIETLAERTHGKAYAVADGTGPDAINNPMAGSLTYQPSVPMANMEILVLQESYQDINIFSTNFTMDKFMGGDITIQVDVGFNSANSMIGTLEITNNDLVETLNLDMDGNGVFQLYRNDSVWTGDVMINADLSKQIDFLSLKVTSKPPGDTLPLRTRCWTSAGSETVSVSDGSMLYVLAEVKQGNSPVIGARVMAYIERSGVDAPIELELLDAGADPDQVGNDGVYARYFTRFDKDDRYSLKCQVEGTDQTNINQGFLDAKRGLPSKPSAENPVCCGSNTINKDSKLEPTGTFSRSSIAGSFQVTGVPPDNTDIYPPGTVKDLKLVIEDTETLEMSFTAPGDDLDFGTASKYEVFYSNNKTALEITNMINNDTCDVIDDNSLMENTTLTPMAAGVPVAVLIDLTILELEQAYFFRLHVEDEGGLSSWSNVASVFNHKDEPASSSTSVSTTHGLIVFVLLTIVKYY